MVDTNATFAGILIRRGFTLVEMVAVLGIISIVSGMALFGLSQYNNTQPLFNAQKELLTNLRSVQNQVVNGSEGVSVKSVILDGASPTSYTIVNSYLGASLSTTQVNLPSNVSFFGLSGVVAICFSNPNLTSFGSDQKCVYSISSGGSCNNSNLQNKMGYVCAAGTPPVSSSPASFTITLAQGSSQKKVILEGSGMKINRIYAP